MTASGAPPTPDVTPSRQTRESGFRGPALPSADDRQIRSKRLTQCDLSREMRRVQIVGPSASPPEHVSQYSAGNAVFWLLFACYRPILAIAALQAEQIAVRRTPAATECGFGYRSLRAAIRRLRGVLPLRSLLALPDDSQISNADRSALTRGFAQQHFVQPVRLHSIRYSGPRMRDRYRGNYET
jgi:hypothetical protein